MRNILLKLIFLLMLSLLIFSAVWAQESIKNLDNLLVGFWSDAYPVSDEIFGYIFLDDHSYIYYDQHSYNIKNRYSGCIGKWQIVEYKIQITMGKHIYWKNNWIQENIGMTAGESNYIYAVKNNDTRWITIGDIRSYTEDKYYEEASRKVFLKPANIFLKPIINSIAPDSQKPYWRFTVKPLDDKYLRQIIEQRRNL